MGQKHWGIEPDIPLEHIIQSAGIIGKKITGRYVINSLHPEPCGRANLSPEVILEKYEQVRRELGEEKLPEAAGEKIWWISRRRIEQTEVISFSNDGIQRRGGLQFCLQVFHDHLNTTVIPVVLFLCPETPQPISFEDHNRQAFKMLRYLRNKPRSNPQLATVHQGVKHALRRLLTEDLAKERIRRCSHTVHNATR